MAGDCISREEIIYHLANIAKMKARSDAQKSLMGRCIFVIANMPSVEPSRPHGEWIETEFGLKCSHCNRLTFMGRTERHIISDFCPNCGADMRLKEKNNADSN